MVLQMSLSSALNNNLNQQLSLKSLTVISEEQKTSLPKAKLSLLTRKNILKQKNSRIQMIH